MQSAPSEAPLNATSVDQSRDTLSSSQHGHSSTPELASGRLLREDARESFLVSDNTDSASISSSSTGRGRRNNSGRLSLRGGSSQEGSPGSKIEEYEKANTYGRKKHGTMGFQIVSSGKQNIGHVSLDHFPNEVLTHVLSHLTPETLSSMSLVSKRFHKLITTPHAWRIAFARYFPGQDTAETVNTAKAGVSDVDGITTSDKRVFSRLSALASWRSEYILRTRLLRSLGRGRPALQALARGSNTRHGTNSAAAVTTFGSGLLYPVSHIHATFGIGLNKKQPMFMHGAVEQGVVSTSDPSTGKTGNWGLSDFEAFKYFADIYAGEIEYGLGPGDIIGMPNVMDVSQPYGRIYGEACPGGRVFYTSTSEQRGRFLSITSSPVHELGIPDVNMIGCAVTSVWIAKSDTVLKTTNGVFGMLAGFSNGVLAAYALGVNPVHDRRFEKGQETAKWVLSPGVPIIAICVDEKFTARRHSMKRIWAVVLNALGEVFYLTDTPTRPDFKGRAKVAELDPLAWQTGRTVEWSLVESTRRVAKPDPFNSNPIDGSYSPRTSSYAAGLSKEQVVAETREIETFLRRKPKYFRGLCEGWDMQRKLVVDFGGDDHHGAGEAIFIVNTGLADGMIASIRRLTRHKTKNTRDFDLEPYPGIQQATHKISIFGPQTDTKHAEPAWSFSPRSAPRSRASSQDDVEASYHVDWRQSTFSFGDLRVVQISATASDDSEFAVLAAFEDPLLGMSGGSNSSSPFASPLGQTSYASSPSEIPGHRARFFAAGTTTGVVLLWDMRASTSHAADVINTIQPLHAVYTKSPQISSLAMTSLYLVHGGNDGLVQAWDPLVSNTEPIRTLNSRFSDRARRRIAQAEASAQGVGNNYYAAGAIVLDPDPTVLRGMVSLGTHLRYWSYSASAADAYKSRKRGQLRRRSERGSNSAANEQKYNHNGRGILKDYIATERQDMEKEKIVRAKESERLSGRFGTNLLGEGASDEELLRYAMMVSEESFASDQVKRQDSGSESAAKSKTGHDQEKDQDLEEAIRLSLLDSETSSPIPATYEAAPSDFWIPVRYAKSFRHATASKTVAGSSSKGPTTTEEESELEFAMQLSLAEESSRLGEIDVDEEYPALGRVESGGSSESGSGKGKGKRTGRN